MTSEFNWSWIETPAETANESNSVLQDGGTVYSYKQAYSGQVSAADLNAFVDSTGQNFQSVRSNWRLYIRPILNSLPAGGKDSRWATDTGKALPAKIDCFTYGVQGSTLFVFNDASATKADGRYWVADQYRPKTIAEKFEDLYSDISDISTAISTDSTVDLDPLWAAIGEGYRDSSYVGGSGSLDTRTSTLESYINQLNTDIYEPTSYSYSLGGTALPYSIAKNIDELLQIHNVAGWGSNPANVDHSHLAINPPPYAYTEIEPGFGQSITQGRIHPYTTLDNDIKRLRYEIGAAKGTTWNADPLDPVTGSNDGDLATHMSYVGSGVLSTNNPHKIGIVQTGADLVFNAVRSYTGMIDNTDTTPAYSSNHFVTDGDDLTTAIGKLDTAINSSLVTRMDYGPIDRSAMSETDREQTPAITVNHNLGQKPIVQVVDVSPEETGYYGQYTSPDVYVNVTHLSDNAFEVWTNGAIIEVVALF